MSITFVYNTTSDIWSKSLDIAHKIICPSTYSCDLCSLTYDKFSEKEIWKDFRENTDAEFVFMHKDEFLKYYPKSDGYKFPIVLQKKREGFNIICDSSELASLESVEELIETLKKRI